MDRQYRYISVVGAFFDNFSRGLLSYYYCWTYMPIIIFYNSIILIRQKIIDKNSFLQIKVLKIIASHRGKYIIHIESSA